MTGQESKELLKIHKDTIADDAKAMSHCPGSDVLFWKYDQRDQSCILGLGVSILLVSVFQGSLVSCWKSPLEPRILKRFSSFELTLKSGMARSSNYERTAKLCRNFAQLFRSRRSYKRVSISTSGEKIALTLILAVLLLKKKILQKRVWHCNIWAKHNPAGKWSKSI